MQKQIRVILWTLMIVTLLGYSTAIAEGGYDFVTKWGSECSGEGQFHYPHGIAVNAGRHCLCACLNLD